MKTKCSNIARYFASAAGIVALMYTGCSMCCGPYDYDYPSFGGAVQRSNPTWGRVGSVYSDPGPFGGPGADSNLKPHDSGIGYGDGPLENVPEPDNPTELDGSGNRNEFNNGSDILPEPPQPGPQTRPGPDEETRRSEFMRLRNQSRSTTRKWR